MAKDDPVIVVGGGIGGLAAALALANRGVAVQVLEQSSRFGEIGAGIQLSPNVFRMFDRLGVTGAIERDACFVEALIMMDSVTGAEVTKVPLTQAFRAKFGKPYAVTHRADLHDTLHEACRASNLIELRNSTKIADFEETADGVTARTDAGEAFHGAALIACDGLWSTIRAKIAGDGAPRVSGHIAYRAVLPIEQAPEEIRWNAATLWAGPRTHLVHYPLRRGELFNIVAVFHSDRYVEGWNQTGDREELMKWFGNAHDHCLALLEKVTDWRYWVLCDREPIADWTKGRATLLGDAAHPMLQYFAQGACMAIEDAVCLADAVEAAERNYAAAFQAYQQQRYLRTARVQLMARFLGEIYHAADVRRELRNHVLGQRTPEQAYEGLAWLYGGP